MTTSSTNSPEYTAALVILRRGARNFDKALGDLSRANNEMAALTTSLAHGIRRASERMGHSRANYLSA